MIKTNTCRIYVLLGAFFLLYHVLVAEAQASSSSDQMELARQSYVKGNYDQAIKHLQNVLSQKSNNIEAYKLLGICYIKTRFYNLALDNFLFAHKLNPQEMEYLYYKGLCEWKLKRVSSSLESLEKALVYDPNNVLCYKVIGSMFFDIEMMDDAKRNFDKVLGIEYDFETSDKNKLIPSVSEENYQVAYHAVTNEIKHDPKEYRNYFFKGMLDAAKGNYEGAYTDFDMSISLNPESALGYYYKAFVAYKLKRYEDCMNSLYKYHKKYPQNEEIRGQIDKIKDMMHIKNMYVSSETGQINYIAEQMPEFAGGKNALANYLSKNIQFPKEAYEKKAYGKVFISFVIDTVGRTGNFIVVRSIGKAFDEEALRLVKNMPLWEPAKQNGKKVPIRYTLPIAFKFEE